MSGLEPSCYHHAVRLHAEVVDFVWTASQEYFVIVEEEKVVYHVVHLMYRSCKFEGDMEEGNSKLGYRSQPNNEK